MTKATDESAPLYDEAMNQQKNDLSCKGVWQLWAEDCEGVQGEEEGSQPRVHLLHVSGSRSELFFCHLLLWFVAIFCDNFD